MTPSEIQLDVFVKSMARHVLAERKTKHMTQAELSKRSGVHVRTISNFERGTRTLRLDKISDVANALGMTLTDLIERAVNDINQLNI